MDAQWVEHERWVDAVADAVYPITDAPGPVYLDLESDVLEAIGEVAGYDGSTREGLREAVRAVTVRDGTFSLSLLWQKQMTWRRTRLVNRKPPPSLPFLALTVLAAEDMGSADDGHTPNSYYARLCSLLDLPADQTSVRQQYMRRAEQLWGDLNRWLEDLEGERGIPTAYSLTYRYVGLPLSQALVREGDRRKLPAFFAQYGLPAGAELAPEVLSLYLGAWFGGETCSASASLRRLWGKPATRERIAAVAAVELVSWDGIVRDGDSASMGPQHVVGLMAQIRSGFMSRKLDLALTLRATLHDSFEDGIEVESAAGDWLPVNFVPAAANLWRTTFTGGIDDASVLEGVVSLRQVGLESRTLKHHPRSLVPLVHDELQMAFVEAERLQLNADSALLVREEVRGRPLVDDVLDVLQACARPGFVVERSMPGLPPGWVLITGVQLFAAPTSTRLNELVPLARDQLTIAGGLRIPSRIRKWSAVAPPEVRVAVESAETLRLVVLRSDDGQEVFTRAAQGGALVVSLAEAGLGAGDFQIALYAGGSKDPLQQATLRLRSSDGVDSAWQLAPRLVYGLSSPGGPAGALTATEVLEEQYPDVLVDGAMTTGVDLSDASPIVPAGIHPFWSQAGAAAPRSVVRVGTPDPGSCVVTGAHHLEYPTYWGGKQPRYIDGACKFCGLVKRSPGWIPRQARKKNEVDHVDVDVTALPAVAPGSGHLWDAALDALMHLGGGDASTLTSVAAQIDGSSVFTSAFPSHLEALGHIAVQRSPAGVVERWEISPSCLLVRGDRTLELVGHWPDQTLEDLLEDLSDAGAVGAEVVRTVLDSQPARRFIQGVDVSAAEEVASDARAEVLESAADGMLAALPALSRVVAAAPRVAMVGFSRAERFDVASASWTQANDVHSPGAYRLVRDFERVHVFRSALDVESGSAVRGSTHVVKHFAANDLGTSLARFIPSCGHLAVPLGSDLPGLYARAMVLASGTLPTARSLVVGDSKRNALLYDGVTQEQADLLVTLLSR